jgi:hypothetical protein
MSSTINFNFHKSFDGYVANINIPEEVIIKTTDGGLQPEFVFLLDRSCSMEHNVSRIINHILPKALINMNYKPTQEIHIVTYDNTANYYKTYINDLQHLSITSQGGTCLVPGLQKLNEIMTSIKNSKVRLLHLSDGEIWDINEAIQYTASNAKQFTNGKMINSQAVRFIIAGSPDTRGLSSTLQFSNTQKSKLIDVDYVTDENGYISLAKQLSQLFEGDGLSYNVKLSVDDNIISSNPWETKVNQINLMVGENTLWFREIPKTIHITNITSDVNVVLKDNINLSNIGSVISDRLEFYMDRIRILKVANSNESQTEIQNILNYFDKFQTYLNTTEMIENYEYTPDLRYRFNIIKRNIEQQRRSIFNRLNELANDEMVSQLNSAQQANYLRGVSVTKNTKGLARRAMKNGFDLTQVIHNEVKTIHANLKELDGIDNSNHNRSFYSMETTLEGIKTLAQLVDEDILEETSVSDIIQLANIVGIGCYHQVGDYPDAMTYRIHDLYPGTYISVSDITICQVIKDANKLRPPGFPDKEIVNCVPIFDDVRIHDFVKKYCPTLLNLIAGVGMRRVLADVPSTHMYTICAGLWMSIDMFATNRSEILMETIKQLADTYDRDVGTYFYHNEAFLIDQDTKTSYFINNNGLTNMLNLIHHQYKKHNIKNMSRIIRAIYCYEFYQTLKKIVNRSEDKLKCVENTLVDLLSLDYYKYGTQVGEPFTETPKPKHNNTYTINTKLLNDLLRNYQYFKNLYMVPLVFNALETDNYKESLKQIPIASNDLMVQTIDIDYELEKFEIYSVVESIIYHSKQLRISDKTSKIMNLPDIGYQSEAEKMINTFIVNYYQKFYNFNLRNKTGKEYDITIQEMINRLISCDYEEFEQIMNSGFTYKSRFAQLINTTKKGFIELGDKLCDTSINVPHRFHKLWVYILGKNQDNKVIWNGGNAIRVDLRPYEYVFNYFNQSELWELCKKCYMNSIKHLYRGGANVCNRHGHHNNKPSYWALGFNTIKDMKTKISNEEYQQYSNTHCDCCGFNSVSLYQRKKMARVVKSLNQMLIFTTIIN